MKLFVANLDYQVLEEDLEQAFRDSGYQPAKITLPQNRENPDLSRGFAFVEFYDSTEARKAMEDLHGQELLGRVIRVVEARPEERTRETPGARRGRR
jgi:RNA recognition motif-containing protein